MEVETSKTISDHSDFCLKHCIVQLWNSAQWKKTNYGETLGNGREQHGHDELNNSHFEALLIHALQNVCWVGVASLACAILIGCRKGYFGTVWDKKKSIFFHSVEVWPVRCDVVDENSLGMVTFHSSFSLCFYSEQVRHQLLPPVGAIIPNYQHP